MQPFDALTEEDKAAIADYVRRYADCEVEDVRAVLSVWNASKQELFDKMGGVLRKEFEIDPSTYDCHVRTAVEDLYAAPGTMDYAYFARYERDFLLEMYKSEFVVDFFVYLCDGINVPVRDFKKMCKVFRMSNAMAGRIVTCEKRVKFEYKDRHAYVSNGDKFMAAVGKLVRLYGYDDSKNKYFKEFKDLMSMANTVTGVSHKFVVSIHPTDFLTASDNSCGWTSCFSIAGKGSCGVGSVEMMNGDPTAITYLEHTSPYEFMGHEVPNKQWRSYVYVTDEQLVAGRSYPFESRQLSCDALRCTCEAMDLHYDLMPKEGAVYSDMRDVTTTDEARNDMPLPDDLWLATYKAYNDMAETDDEFLCYKDYGGFGGKVYVSGYATCLSCGGPLEDGKDEYRVTPYRKLYCRRCAEEKMCFECGVLHKSSDVHKVACRETSDDTVSCVNVCEESLKDLCYVDDGSYIFMTKQRARLLHIDDAVTATMEGVRYWEERSVQDFIRGLRQDTSQTSS